MLLAFMLLEWQKGEDSYWFPYLQILPKEAHCFWRWDPKLIKETQDPAFQLMKMKKVKIYREGLEEVMAVFRMYPNVFN